MELEDFIDNYKAVRRRKSEIAITALNIQSLPYISDKKKAKQIIESLIDNHLDEKGQERKVAADRKSFRKAFGGMK